MTLAIDGSASTTSTGTVSTVSAALTTTNANVLLIAQVKTAAAADGTVTSITDTTGLTWTKRKAQAWKSGSTFEQWYAVSTGAYSGTITANLSASTANSKRIIVYGVSGADMTTPFDTNASVPYSATAGGVLGLGSASNISTNASDTMLIYSVGNDTGLGTVTRPAGFNQVLTTGSAHDVSAKVVTATQTSVNNTVTWTSTGTSTVGIWDAIRAAGSTGGGGGAAVVAGIASLTSSASATASVTASAPSGGAATITTQWYRSVIPNSLGVAIPGATALALNDTGLTDGLAYYYTAVFTDGTTTASSKQIAVVPNKTLYVGLIGDSWNTTTTSSAGVVVAGGSTSAGALLQDKIKALFNDARKIVVNNQGIGGTNGSVWVSGSTNLTNALAAFLTAHSPSSDWTIAVHLGVNDSSNDFSTPLGGETKAQYKTYLTNISAAIIAWGGNVVLHKPPFIGDISSNHTIAGAALLAQYGDAVDEIAATNPGRIFVGADEYKYYLMNASDFGSDLVHPTPSDANGKGGATNLSAMWARAIYQVLSKSSRRNTYG